MKSTFKNQARRFVAWKLPVTLFLSLQVVMGSAIGQSLFTISPQLSVEESEEIKSAIQAAAEKGDEAAAIPIKMDASVLAQEFIVFAVPNGPTYLFNRTSTNEQGGKFGWYGETHGGAVQAHFQRLTKGLNATVYVPATNLSPQFQYTSTANTNGVGILRKVSATRQLPHHTPGEMPDYTRRESGSCPEFVDSSSQANSATPAVQIDVLVVYTEAADAAAYRRLAADIGIAIDHCNEITKNSKAPNITFNLVGQQKVGYEEENSNVKALDWVSTDASVRGLREKYGADVVILVVGGKPDSCGVAWPFPSAANAFGVVYSGGECLTSKYYSLAHEIGHIIGLDHDIANSNAAPFVYGHRAYISTPCVHTVMSYANKCDDVNWTTAMPIFSFPNNHKYSSTSSLGNSQFADNRRVLSCQSNSVANFGLRKTFVDANESGDQKPSNQN